MFLDMGQIVLMFVMKWNGSRKKGRDVCAEWSLNGGKTRSKGDIGGDKRRVKEP